MQHIPPQPAYWHIHDTYIKSRFGHDRLWIGLFGIGPAGEWVGYRLLSDEYISRVIAFLNLAILTPNAIREELADVATWDNRRWSTWRGSYAEFYSELVFGEGRQTLDMERNAQEREATLDACLAHFVKEPA